LRRKGYKNICVGLDRVRINVRKSNEKTFKLGINYWRFMFSNRLATRYKRIGDDYNSDNFPYRKKVVPTTVTLR